MRLIRDPRLPPDVPARWLVSFTAGAWRGFPAHPGPAGTRDATAVSALRRALLLAPCPPLTSKQPLHRGPGSIPTCGGFDNLITYLRALDALADLYKLPDVEFVISQRDMNEMNIATATIGVSAKENERRQLPIFRYARSDAWDEILIPVRRPRPVSSSPAADYSLSDS